MKAFLHLDSKPPPWQLGRPTTLFPEVTVRKVTTLRGRTHSRGTGSHPSGGPPPGHPTACACRAPLSPLRVRQPAASLWPTLCLPLFWHGLERMTVWKDAPASGQGSVLGVLAAAGPRDLGCGMRSWWCSRLHGCSGRCLWFSTATSR